MIPSTPERASGPTWRLFALCVAPALLLALYYDARAWEAVHSLGFPLDDAWIHAQFARNLATGRGFTYDGVHWVAGSTSPAWTSLLALGFVVTRSILIAAKLLGLALQLLCGVLAAQLVLSLTGISTLALLTGLATAALPAVTWGAVSGMEVTLACALVLGGFYAYLAGDNRGPRCVNRIGHPVTPRRRLAAIVLLSLGCLARPETLVLLGILIADILLRADSVKTLVHDATRTVAVLIVVLGPFVLFAFLTTGGPLPTTFYAKSGPGLVRALSDGNGHQIARLLLEHGPNAVRQFGATLLDQLGATGCLVFACGVVGILSGWRRHRGAGLMLLGVVASAFAIGVVAPQRLKPDNFRYTAQLVCLALVAASCGLAFLWLRARSLVRLVAPCLLVACTVYESVAAAPVYARSVKNIQELHVALAEWMRGHLPPACTVAVNDVGALAYFGERRVVDLEGLVSPEALKHPRQQRGISFVEATRPDYIAIFPGWYPDIMARPDLFPEIYRVSIPDNYVAAGDTIVVLRTPWTRFALRSDGPVPRRRPRWPS